MTDDHAGCQAAQDSIVAGFQAALDAERRRHTADAKAGALLRRQLGNVRWKVMKRADLAAYFDDEDIR